MSFTPNGRKDYFFFPSHIFKSEKPLSFNITGVGTLIFMKESLCTQCSRINNYSNFISQDLRAITIRNEDTLNMQKNLKYHREILKTFKFWPK